MAAGRAPRPADSTADLTAPRRSPLEAVQLYLIATLPGGELSDEQLDRLAAAASGGVDAIQLRMKQASTAQRRAALLSARAGLPGSVLLLINDDLEAVFDAHGEPLADGVHLGREDAEALADSAALANDVAAAEGARHDATHATSVASVGARRTSGLRVARARLGSQLALGTSTREAWEVDAAQVGGADHVGFGAIATSNTKHNTAHASLDTLQAVTTCKQAFPVFPIGGLNLKQLAELATRGIRRAAVGAAIFDAPDPASAAQQCRAALIN